MANDALVQHAPTVRNALDGAIGAAGVTSPAWLPMLSDLNTIAATVATVGGAVLVVIRIAIAVREWQQGRGRR